MFHAVFPQFTSVFEYWSRTVNDLMWDQWRWFDAQYAAGIQWLDAATGASPGSSNPLQTLEQKAIERVQKGLAPPREIYEAQYRSQIDWSRFPEWARPIDPEVFEGSGHEG